MGEGASRERVRLPQGPGLSAGLSKPVRNLQLSSFGVNIRNPVRFAKGGGERKIGFPSLEAAGERAAGPCWIRRLGRGASGLPLAGAIARPGRGRYFVSVTLANSTTPAPRARTR